MGADKNSSPKRELGLYPDCHLIHAHTHNSGSKLGTHKPTRSRDKPQTKLEGLEAEANHKRRSNKLSAWVGVDCPHSRGGPSAVPWQTIRAALADCLKKPLEPPVAHHEKKTIRRLPADRPPRADRPYSTHGPSAKPRAPKIHRQYGSNGRHERTHDEHKEHLAESLPADRLHGSRRLSVRSVGSSSSLTLSRSTLPSFHPISRINQGKATKS
jgi:hypothetical protein